ncbi:MAG TPA: transketolase [Geminicoccaceae bacterium]|nr:transketolase [Geminicoccaceae bacterium]
MTETPSHHDLANALRALAMDAVERAKSGHPGMPMGMADVATVLFTRHLKFVASKPEWPDRDRFVLSAGHGSMLLYALLHLTGYPDMTVEELQRFRQLGSRTAGHPEYGHAFGIETTTGPLGQGLATAVGMALAERLLAARFGADLVDHHTWVIASDGDLMEGLSHEAASIAGHFGLARLTVLFDDNGISIDGPTSLTVSDDQVRRFQAYGWEAAAVDGHDAEAVDAALAWARNATKPTLIACRTVIAKGAPTKAGTAASHGAPLGAKEIEAARQALGWTAGPFEVPEPIRAAWLAAGRRGEGDLAAWRERLAAADAERRAAFERALSGELPPGLGAVVEAYKQKLVAERPAWATRKASQEALQVLTEAVPEMVGGSADLTGSVNTNTRVTGVVRPKELSGRYVHWGVREHGMVAAMNGMAVHKGLIPYGGTFLVFADYCRPAIRIAALMQQRVILVATHDSIGLGEDGPTHQPVEHLASLRAMPNLLVLRPADPVETVECWQAALENSTGPSVIALTRQTVPFVRVEHTADNLAARGAYVLAEAEQWRDATIIATGSEVGVALEARRLLAGEGIDAAVVSMPSFELFERQDPAYKAAVLGAVRRFAVEAASPFGWTRYVASEDHVIGLTSFGASGPHEELYRHFGITAERVAQTVKSALAQ